MNVWWSSSQGRWDTAIVSQALNRIPHTDYNVPPPTNEGVVAILVHKVSDGVVRQLQDYPWVLAIHTSDESHEWDAEQIRRPGVKIWMQYPNEKCRGDRNILIGCPEDTSKLIPELKPLKDRKYDWVFSGQVNHSLREDMVRNLQGNGVLNARTGFAQGNRKEHLVLLSECRIAPCPSGTVHPDSFRFAEAIECGCVPVVDTPSFWYKMGVPVESVAAWREFPYILEAYQDDPDSLQRKSDELGTWWSWYKRCVSQWIIDDIAQLSG